MFILCLEIDNATGSISNFRDHWLCAQLNGNCMHWFRGNVWNVQQICHYDLPIAVLLTAPAVDFVTRTIQINSWTRANALTPMANHNANEVWFFVWSKWRESNYHYTCNIFLALIDSCTWFTVRIKWEHPIHTVWKTVSWWSHSFIYLILILSFRLSSFRLFALVSALFFLFYVRAVFVIVEDIACMEWQQQQYIRI